MEMEGSSFLLKMTGYVIIIYTYWYMKNIGRDATLWINMTKY